MSSVAELARELALADEASGGSVLVYGVVTRDMETDREVAIQADGLPLDEQDLGFAAGLRQGVKRGDRVLLLRTADSQRYDVLLKME